MTVAVGLSGGVDSAVAAWLLRREGHEVVGLTMLLDAGGAVLPGGRAAGCRGAAAAADLEAARAVAARLGIRHVSVPLGEAFRREVLEPLRETCRAGRTPNPCLLCNRRIKFAALPAAARAAGVAFERLATGHYARLAGGADGRHRLLAATDRAKDQSYFLARLTQEQLARAIFPLGGLAKDEVVALARAAGLGDIAERGESQDFGDGRGYGAFLAAGDALPGPLVDTSGRVLGRHRGVVHYTVGQRKGVGVAAGRPLYVKSLCAATRTVVLGRREELFSGGCRLEQPHWIAAPPADGAKCLVRLRYRHPGARATLRLLPGGGWIARFAAPQFAVAPGQAAVCYRGDEVLGGGWIAPL